MHQVHGATVVDAATLTAGGARVQADAAFTTVPGVVCAVSVADCLPVAIAHAGGRGVAVAHAGWRGLAAGVIQNCVSALRTQLGAPDTVLLAWLGPAIGPARFEVGEEVLEAMRARLPHASDAFIAGSAGKFFADLPALARQSLAQVDVAQVSGGSFCTASDPARFYSFRRERVTGRHAAVIWLRD
jgi:YfiH family protein